MSLIVLLDAGPLGMITNPKSSPENEACKKLARESRSEFKLVRAEENSPRREPWGSCEIAKPRHGAEDCDGAIFRPLPGAFRSPLIPTAYAVGYYLSPFGLENVLARFYARNHVSLNGAYEDRVLSKLQL